MNKASCVAQVGLSLLLPLLPRHCTAICHQWLENLMRTCYAHTRRHCCLCLQRYRLLRTTKFLQIVWE